MVGCKPENWLTVLVDFEEVGHDPGAVGFSYKLLGVFAPVVKLMVAKARDVHVHSVERHNHLLALVEVAQIARVEQVPREKNKFFCRSVLVQSCHESGSSCLDWLVGHPFFDIVHVVKM